MQKILPFLMCLIFIIASCTTTKYVEKEVPMIETRVEYIDREVHDSINVRDSIFMFINGDTVYKYKEHLKIKYVYKTDTIFKSDSIPIPVKITEAVTNEVNKLYWWQKALMWLGIISTIVLIIKLKSIFKL